MQFELLHDLSKERKEIFKTFSLYQFLAKWFLHSQIGAMLRTGAREEILKIFSP